MLLASHITTSSDGGDSGEGERGVGQSMEEMEEEDQIYLKLLNLYEPSRAMSQWAKRRSQCIIMKKYRYHLHALK